MSETTDNELRKIAKKRLKKKTDFTNYLLVWFLVSALLTGIWVAATPGTPFWPGFAIAGMGIAAVFIGWDAYGPRSDITEGDIDAEIQRMNKRRR
jgi:membrane protein implicated in regulation of membrane protease activity